MHYLIMEEFSTALEVYKPYEVEDPAYRELIYATKSFHYPTLWREYNSNTRLYDPSRSKAAMMHLILMRYIQKVMERLFILAGKSEGVIGYWSFFYIHYMLVGIPMHLGHDLLLFLVHQTSLKKGEGFICVGPYIM